MSPSARLATVLSVATMLGVILTAVLIFAALDRLRSAAEEANTDFVITQLRESIEASVSLGLTLDDIRVAQDLIERANAANGDILAIEVFSPSGTALYSTDRGALGEQISATWSDVIDRAAERWRLTEPGALVVGEPIRNDFDEVVGGIAITVALAGQDRHAGQVLRALIPATLIGAAIVGVLVVGLVWGLLYRAGREFRTAAAVLAGDGDGASPSGSDGLVAEAVGVRCHIERSAKQTLDLAERVQALDEDAWELEAPELTEAEEKATADGRL